MEIRDLINQLEQLAEQYGDEQRVVVLYDVSPNGYRTCSHYDVSVSAPGEVAIECKI